MSEATKIYLKTGEMVDIQSIFTILKMWLKVTTLLKNPVKLVRSFEHPNWFRVLQLRWAIRSLVDKKVYDQNCDLIINLISAAIQAMSDEQIINLVNSVKENNA